MRQFLLVLLASLLWLGVSEAQVLRLSGHLDREVIEQAQQQLRELRDAGAERVVLEINSSSGELTPVLDLARALYELRAEQGTQLIVYIDDNALGPAAALPFLADELYTSVFVGWGDMLLTSENALPLNVLRSRVRSLVSGPQSAKLQLLVEGMVDPELVIVDENGTWRRADAEAADVVSPKGERLVVNHNQLRELGLTRGALSLTAFRQQLGLTQDETSQATGLRPATAQEASLLGRLEATIQWDEAAENQVGHIAITDSSGISNSTFIYVKSALDYYKETKPKFIILELNTPGGEVFASQRISDALKEMDTNYGIPVVAHINNWAISAGAMLAYSCRFIAVAKDAAMGAAEPVIMGGGEVRSASEKMNSALRTDFANRAGFFDRDPDIAEAMVDKDIILVKRFGRVVRLDREEDIRTGAGERDEVLSAKGKLLTLKADQMIELGVADIFLEPTRVDPLTADEETTGRYPASKEELFQEAFFKQIPNAMVDAYRPDWRIQFIAFLNLPAVASVLFLGMMLGGYVEINSPGVGFPGAIALVCLSLIIISSVASDAASLLEIIMVVAGLGLIAAELFIIPGFGVAGIVGILLMLVGMISMMLPGFETVSYELDGETLNAAGQEIVNRIAWLAGSFVLAVILMALLSRYLSPTFGPFARLVSVGAQESSEGYVSGADLETLPDLGATGTVYATLRPAGRVEIAGELYEGMSDGQWIEEGTKIKVIEIRSGRLIVAAVEENA